MNIAIKKITYLLVLITTIMTSCEDHPFNLYPIENVSYDRIFSDSIRTIGVVNAAYSRLTYANKYFRIGGAMQACATDEAKLAEPSTNIDNFINGRWDPNNIPDPAWIDMYEGIRHINQFLPFWVEKTKLPLSETSYRRTYSELIFLRAFYYFELFKRYGGVPIITKVLNPGDNMNIPRNTYSQTLDFIVSQCDLAATYAKLNYGNSPTDFGRVTKGAIYSLKSRALLYAASPLVNSPSDYGDGSDLNIWQGNYDIERWKLAAEAALQVVSLNQYQLYEGPDFTPYFNDSYWSNKEFIFGRLWTNDNTMETQNAPLGYTTAMGATCPTQDFVDAFENKDGEPFDWSNADQAADPYSNRDPRLNMYVFHNGSEWWYSDNRQSSSDKTIGYIETFTGGADDPALDPSSVRTGYYLRKFSNIQATIFGTVSKANHNFTIFRYAEILLNFAEAANEYGGPDFEIGGKTARWAVNQVRQRVGMPDIDSEITQSLLREKIHNERRIELAFEEHRFWDVRRWKIALNLKKSIDGIKITKQPDDSYIYTRLLNLEPRVFEQKHYFYPIPQWEINRNSALTQNPKW